ncbi:hypothetical protein P3342_007405 [Pyrenophora teres f. teres]|nr:hypothetical protein P3342_007405 [Pyrenophora teres f. teres]
MHRPCANDCATGPMLDLRNAGGRGMSGSNGRSGQLVQLGIAEEVCDGQVDASSACLAHQLHRGNRVAAQAEEAVVEADAVCVDGQHARPQLLHRALRLRLRLPLQPGLAFLCVDLLLQRLAVDLAVLVDWHGIQDSERLRNHISGQLGFQHLQQPLLRLLQKLLSQRPAAQAVQRSLCVVGGESEHHPFARQWLVSVEDGIEAALLRVLPAPADLNAAVYFLRELNELGRGRDGQSCAR